MLLYDENLQQLSEAQIAALKQELLTGLDTIAVPEQQELESDLADYYVQADAQEKGLYQMESLAYKAANMGETIFERIRKFICGFLAADSTASDIIDKILEAIASIIPGGIIIKWIVKKLVKYILNIGYQALCPTGN
ncbi:hypothetical protein ACFQZX_18140 [Mucilaginibacter litoreus]|uniref:Uncharacterized protein n=1 Tax=Mucilaginibacter litoreus TaxID=1048221 RepID=A0ABW3AX81_9SPHI